MLRWLMAVCLCLLATAMPGRADSKISVLFIRTADDDGANASTLTEATAKAAIEGANAIYKRNGGDVQFVLDSASSFTTVLQSTVLNHDCTLPPGATAASIASHTQQVADTDTLCDQSPAAMARAATALQCAGKLVVFSRGRSEKVKWDDQAHHYELVYTSGGYSGKDLYYVVLGSVFSGPDLAHEMGHYFGLKHPFPGNRPATVAEAEADIGSFVAAGHSSEANGLKVFDGDGLSDTPPDAAGSVFLDYYKGEAGANCDANHPTVPLTVHFPIHHDPDTPAHDHPYTLEPDRHDVMSYFKDCPGFDQHLTKQQYKIVHASLASGGNRVQLVKGLPVVSGDGCRIKGAGFACPLQPPPADPSKQLTESAQRIAACYKLWHEPVPGEINEWADPGTPLRRFTIPTGIVAE
jgi:hypothetical protein